MKTRATNDLKTKAINDMTTSDNSIKLVIFMNGLKRHPNFNLHYLVFQPSKPVVNPLNLLNLEWYNHL